MRTLRLLAVSILLILPQGPEPFTRENFPALRSPYLGQTPPGKVAERFAPGIVSVRNGPDSPPQFSRDGQEVYWSHIGPGGGIMVSRMENGRWTFPEKVSWSSGGGGASSAATGPGRPNMDMTPFFFEGGKKILFLSTRALADGRRPERGFFTFWIAEGEASASAKATAEKKGSPYRHSWKEPAAIDSFYTGRDDFGTIADDGTLYLSAPMGQGRIVRVKQADGKYGKPEPIEPEVRGFPAMVGPKGDFLIVATDQVKDGKPNRDLFVIFRKADGTFTASINMGPTVNSDASEQFASLSPDGKYLFFSSERSGDFDVYWIDARIIEELRRKALDSEDQPQSPKPEA